ncbi:hypothetical protein ACMHYJ_02025 [Castellaniella hirudinis]|uniref:hypothetical protein n=1 Tax=Castellaniella hirudinis TaxID=1144617 RepID=UPI0039C0D8F1
MATNHPWLGTPVWPISPDWADGVLERLEFLTDVHQSPVGAEQRRALRIAPRRSFEFSVVAEGAERTILDIALTGVGSYPVLLPLYHDAADLAVELPPGATFLPADTVQREFRSGLALLQTPVGSGASRMRYEVVMATAGAGGLALANPTRLHWWPGTRVYPIVRARVVGDVQISRVTSRVSQAQLRFDVIDPLDWSDSFPGEVRDGRLVWTVAPNERDALRVDFHRLQSVFDHELGPAQITDTGTSAWLRQQYRFTLEGRAERNRFRQLLYSLRGKQRALWLPTFSDDLIIAQDVALADEGIYVERCGYTQYITAPGQHARRDIRIVLHDGRVFHRRIVAARIEEAADREWLGLDITLPTLAAANVQRIEFLAPMRMDQDSTELHHITDADGVAESVVTFVSAPSLRALGD